MQLIFEQTQGDNQKVQSEYKQWMKSYLWKKERTIRRERERENSHIFRRILEIFYPLNVFMDEFK